MTCPPPTWEELRADAGEWDTIFPTLRKIIKETTGKELPVGMMEYNSNYTNAAGGSTTPDSFYNALWLADVYGRMVSERPEMLAYWLLKNNDAGLDNSSSTPSYYVFSLWSGSVTTCWRQARIQYVSIYPPNGAGAVPMLLHRNGQEWPLAAPGSSSWRNTASTPPGMKAVSARI
jgi:hypothetical protein